MRRALTTAGVVLGLLASACSDDPVAPSSRAPTSDVCLDEERPRLQEGSHLLGDTAPPVPYSSVPPSSGWHRSGQPSLGVLTDPATDPVLVSALEAGHVVVAYDPMRVEQATVDRLAELAQGDFVDRLTVAPYTTAMASPLAVVGWGVIRRCDELDEAVLSAFVLSWFGSSSRAHEGDG